jgi:hypothetical protein
MKPVASQLLCLRVALEGSARQGTVAQQPEASEPDNFGDRFRSLSVVSRQFSSFLSGWRREVGTQRLYAAFCWQATLAGVLVCQSGPQRISIRGFGNEFPRLNAGS